jgi:hypothetical protein
LGARLVAGLIIDHAWRKGPLGNQGFFLRGDHASPVAKGERKIPKGNVRAADVLGVRDGRVRREPAKCWRKRQENLPRRRQEFSAKVG